MTTKICLVSTETGRKFEVLSIGVDKDGKQIAKLRGQYGEFTEEYTKERMQRLKYRMQKVEVED